MEKKACSIFCAGTYYGYEKPVTGSVIIAADGGADYLDSLGVKPDLVIGDFDSSKTAVTDCENVIKLNPVKDKTDTFEAVEQALALDCGEIHIFGGTGGRSAHTFANIQTLAMLAEKSVSAYLYGDNEIITAVHNGKLTFDPSSSGYISVFSLDTECRDVNIKGLIYTLETAKLTNNYPVGVSNEFTGEAGEISVGEGTLLVVYTFKAKLK